MRINPNSNVPIFRQIAEEIQSAIARGIFREGEAIPSARELSLELHVNPNTIQKAFDELSQLGVIETRRGIGKFVCPGAAKDSTKRTRNEILTCFQEGVDKANTAGLTREELDTLYKRAAKGIDGNRTNVNAKKVR